MKIINKLIIAFIIIFIIKSILVSVIPAPSAFADGYIYAKTARSFFYDQALIVHNEIPTQYPPLYSIILSPSYIFNDINNVYLFMKLINVLLSSLIIFPAFFLAKEFISEKKSFSFALLISVLPSNFAFSSYLMSENLFYPLFLISIYFIYKSFRENKLKYDLLASIFIALSYLTRVLSLILPIIVGILIAIELYKKRYTIKHVIKKSLIYLIPFLLIISPWIIRNLLLFGDSSKVGINYYQTNFVTSLNYPSFLLWILLYIGLIVISSGVIFLFMHLTTIKEFFKNKKLSLLTMITYLSLIMLIIVISKYSAGASLKSFGEILFKLSGRPIGRYMDITLPLVILLGFIGIGFYTTKLKEKYFNLSLILISVTLLISLKLIFFPLFPLNNLSLAWIGSLKYLIDLLVYGKQSLDVTFTLASFIGFILLFALIPITILILHYKEKLNLKNIFTFFIVFFLIVSLLNFGLTYRNSKIWHDGEQMQLGIWFNDYDPKISNILIDERDCTGKIIKEYQSTLCEPIKSATIIGFWLNDNLRIGDVSNLKDIDFVITKHNLNLKLIRETKSGIKIYKT
tara:strand:- start:30670 stop:32385 length:1716 start_codon:yes stop_codon:yes gene_type:complete